MLRAYNEVIYTRGFVHRSAGSAPSASSARVLHLLPARGVFSELSAYLPITDTGSLPVSRNVAPLSRLAATRRTNDRLQTVGPSLWYNASMEGSQKYWTTAVSVVDTFFQCMYSHRSECNWWVGQFPDKHYRHDNPLRQIICINQQYATFCLPYM